MRAGPKQTGKQTKAAALQWNLHLQGSRLPAYLFNRLIVCIIGEIIIIPLLNVIAFIVSAVHLKLKLGQLKVFREGIANLSEEHPSALSA